MSNYALIPINIKPHLLPFLKLKTKEVEILHENKKITVLKAAKGSAFGRFFRLLIEKTDQKPECARMYQTFFYVPLRQHPSRFMRKTYRYADGRKGFLHLPKASERILEEYLEEEFEIALFFYVHAGYTATPDIGLESVIITFFEKYNLDEYDFDVSSIRRKYYRRLNSGYFDPKD